MSKTYRTISEGFFAAEDFAPLLKQMRLDSIEAIFAFDGGESLTKSNLAGWRHRRRFQLPDGRSAYLKRYDRPPAGIQLRNWIQHGKRAFLSAYDRGPQVIIEAGVDIPETIAFGGEWSGIFEKRSFIISLEIPDAQSLEKQLPKCFTQNTKDKAAEKKRFVAETAAFVRRFHATGYRHRDLYLCHLFLSKAGTLYLIDLHRCFRPVFLSKRYAIKDLTQLHYSSPARVISRADRLRFFLAYLGQQALSVSDKREIRQIHRKAERMAIHDKRHGRTAPFEQTSVREGVPC